MFEDCKSLEVIDLSKFNIDNATQINGIFFNCKNLKEIIFPTSKTNDNNVSDEIDEIFSSCSSLIKVTNCSDKKILKEFENKKSKSNIQVT